MSGQKQWTDHPSETSPPTVLNQPPKLNETMHISLSFPLLMSSLTFLHQARSLPLLCIFPPFSGSLPRRVRVQDIAEHSVPLKSHVCLLSSVFSLRMKVMQSQKICFLSHYYSPRFIVCFSHHCSSHFTLRLLHAVIRIAGKHSFAGWPCWVLRLKPINSIERDMESCAGKCSDRHGRQLKEREDVVNTYVTRATCCEIHKSLVYIQQDGTAAQNATASVFIKLTACTCMSTLKLYIYKLFYEVKSTWDADLTFVSLYTVSTIQAHNQAWTWNVKLDGCQCWSHGCTLIIWHVHKNSCAAGIA